jgi:Uma2 family endonuclease
MSERVPNPTPTRRCTWSEYVTWGGDPRWEIIAGETYAMTPSPSDRHQRVCSRLLVALATALRGGPCEVVASPIDVKLSEEDVVQPDLVVVCDPGQFKGHIEGAPALVVEVLSPSTEGHDRVRKLRLYARYGVGEYWIARPYPAVLEVLTLDGSGYRVHATYDASGTVTSPNFPNIRLPLQHIFDLPIPPEERIQEIRETRPPYAAESAT